MVILKVNFPAMCRQHSLMITKFNFLNIDPAQLSVPTSKQRNKRCSQNYLLLYLKSILNNICAHQAFVLFVQPFKHLRATTNENYTNAPKRLFIFFNGLF